jgi:hypothetical protein
MHKTHTGGEFYACGSSVSIASVRSAGTLGALVRDGEGVLYGLSNNHVTGGCTMARISMPILAPGVMDVAPEGCAPFTIGRHARVLPMVPGDPAAVDLAQNTDAALLTIEAEAPVSSMQGAHYDTPTEVRDPQESMAVEKIGWTTGHTTGRIDAEIVGAFAVYYELTIHHNAEDQSSFAGSIFFVPVFSIKGDKGPFARPGDSGSLVVTKGPKRRAAVGLIFAGGEPDTSYMLPLRPILERFQVTLVSGHNV